MNIPKISAIVPVYNMEKFLNRCVNSLINQTYTNLEILLIDDGSTDASGRMCDEISENDKRIKVIHKTNGGLSSARNTGIRYCTGDFVTFVDSDDWISLDTYKYCIYLMDKYKSNCVQYDFKMVTSEDPIKQRKESVRCYEGKNILHYYMRSTTKTGSYSVCRCLFPYDAIKNLKFREGKINEDIDFKYKALSHCNKLVVSNQFMYFYYQSGDSLSLGGLKPRDFDLYDAADELVKLTENEPFGNIKFLGRVKKARTPFSLLSKIAYYGISDASINKEELVSNLQKELRRNISPLLLGPLPFSRKILTILFAMSYSLTEKLIHLVRK